MKKWEPREGRHNAHATKVGNGKKRGSRKPMRPVRFVIVQADEDFEAWFDGVKRQLGMA